MADRLLVDLGADGQATVMSWPEGGLPEERSRAAWAWPLTGESLGDLRWYLEDYLLTPFGVWEDRGPAVREQLAGWGQQVFESVFGARPARDAYQQRRGAEVMFRSAVPGLLALPWELMRDEAGPVALGAGGVSRSLRTGGGAGTLEMPGGRLRVLMVISRPAGTNDVGYQMVARPLLERLDAVRGEVELTVLRPPTFSALRDTLRRAAGAGEPYHVVHFDGHGTLPGLAAWTAAAGVRPAMMAQLGEGVLAFEKPGGGSDPVGAQRLAGVVAEGGVPVVVLNACQSGAVGKELEASVATALLSAGCAAVVGMAYSVYAVAAAEFMAEFYESLFAGETVGRAVTAGRRRLHAHDGRPSPKGDMPLADWVIPVHYLRKEVSFPQARTTRPAAALPLGAALDQIRQASPGPEATADPLAAAEVFVGRDDLFYKLEAAAGQQRVVVLTGPGGTGKTELAKGFARWWRDTGGVSHPSLALWHSFEPGVASFGLDGVLSAIGLAVLGTEFALLDPAGRLKQVKALLRQLRVLLIWDNFETVREMPDPDGATPALDSDGCAELKGFLDWVRDHSASTIIITSRATEDWLGPVHRITVGGLNRAESASYADYILGPFPDGQARRERRSFGDLLDWLDGHPLSMRLTLPRLEAADPGAVLAELRGTTPLPASGEAGLDRLSSLGACIAYSFAHLSEPARQLLPVISLFHGIADADVLAVFSGEEGVPGRFAGVGDEEWMAVLDDAARVGLLTGIGSRMYQIHPALPGYLAAAWRTQDPSGYESEREKCEQALCAAFAALSRWLTMQIQSGDAAFGYAVTGLHRRNLGALLRSALDRCAWGDAEDLVRGLNPYWETRGLTGEADAWADRVLVGTAPPGHSVLESAESLWLYITVAQATRQKDAGQPDQAARTYQSALAYLQGQPETDRTRGNISTLFHQLGMTAQDRGQLQEADDWYRRSLAISEELGNRPGQAITYHQLGMTAQDRGQLQEADDWYRRSLAIKEELGNRPGLAITYHQLGMTAQDRGQLQEADDWYRRSLAIKEELGNRPGLAITYHQLGMTAQDRGQLQEADDWYRRSLAISEELGNRPGLAITYHQLGMTAQARGQLQEADDWYRRSLAIKEELGNRPGLAITYHQLGMTAQDRGQLQEADDWYRRSLAIKEELGNRPGLAITYHQLGMTAQDRGQLQEADDWYRRSLAISEELGNRPGLAITYHQLGMTAQDRGQLQEADDWYRRSLAISEELGNRPGLARTYHQLGMTAQARGQLQEADDWYRRSLAIKEELGNRPGLAITYHQLGMTAQDRGQLQEADDWYRRSLAIKEELGNRPGQASTYHQLGMTAQDRGQLQEADDWYRRSLAIEEELGNRPGQASTYAQLGLLSEVRNQPELALRWNVRCVALFDEFPSRFTGTGPAALVRLTRQLGLSAVEQAWREVAGRTLPSQVRDYLTSQFDEPPGDQP